MTTIVGLVHDGKVYMGGDSQTTRHWTQGILRHSKVFYLPKAGLLVGCTGLSRYVDIVKYHADVELTTQRHDILEKLVTVFVPSVREALKTHAASMTENGQEHADESCMLIGYQHRLFVLDSKFSVTEYERGFDAIGSGGDIALGAMAVLSSRMNPEARIKRALQATADCGLYVRPPFAIRNTGELS